jgi:hypothetical protein
MFSSSRKRGGADFSPGFVWWIVWAESWFSMIRLMKMDDWLRGENNNSLYFLFAKYTISIHLAAFKSTLAGAGDVYTRVLNLVLVRSSVCTHNCVHSWRLKTFKVIGKIWFRNLVIKFGMYTGTVVLVTRTWLSANFVIIEKSQLSSIWS